MERSFKFQSTKTFTHSLGLSASYRNWRAVHSHCSFLHGYALQVELVFEAGTLDNRAWVVDFGSLKPVREWLLNMFDHKTLVAKDDPLLGLYKEGATAGIFDLTIVDAISCEAFSYMIYERVHQWLSESGNAERCLLRSVKVSEHSGNSATYILV